MDHSDIENASPERKGNIGKATAKVAKVEQESRGYMPKTQDSSSNEDEYSDQEEETIGGGTV